VAKKRARSSKTNTSCLVSLQRFKPMELSISKESPAKVPATKWPTRNAIIVKLQPLSIRVAYIFPFQDACARPPATPPPQTGRDSAAGLLGQGLLFKFEVTLELAQPLVAHPNTFRRFIHRDPSVTERKRSCNFAAKILKRGDF